MILYIITDTKENARGAGFYHISLALEEAAEDQCLLLHYRHVTPDLVARLQPWAICHSGGSAFFDEYDVLQCEPYLQVIREYPVAQIGFCGGHQLIAHTFGSTLGHMRRLREDEPDPSSYGGGWYKEWGVYPVRVVHPDPLFAGLGEVIRVQEYHMDEVKELSLDLRLLASADSCRVQAYVHTRLPIYGTQFHPEQSPEGYPDGKQVLRNFFRLARDYARVK